MKKIILIMVCLFPSLLYAQTNQERLEPKVRYYADKYDIPVSVMDHIVLYESGYDKTVVGDTELTCKRTGKQMHARGLVQITDCYFPGISDAQALDEDFALNFLAYQISKGHCTWWSTCRVFSETLALR